MESVALGLVLVFLGVPLAVFGAAVEARKFDLVFGGLTADSTAERAWGSANRTAGRRFRQLGVVVAGAAVPVVLAGPPIANWVFGGSMALVAVGVMVIAIRAYSDIADNQRI